MIAYGNSLRNVAACTKFLLETMGRLAAKESPLKQTSPFPSPRTAP